MKDARADERRRSYLFRMVPACYLFTLTSYYNGGSFIGEKTLNSISSVKIRSRKGSRANEAPTNYRYKSAYGPSEELARMR